MSLLKPHEKIVLDKLAGKVLASELLSDLKEKGIVASYKITGYGYFITIKHKDLPVKRIVCDAPLLKGKSNGISTGFIIFIENGQLTLECHGWGDAVPNDYRNQNIEILDDGK